MQCNGCTNQKSKDASICGETEKWQFIEITSVLWIEYMQKGPTITRDVYKQTKRNLKVTIG